MKYCNPAPVASFMFAPANIFSIMLLVPIPKQPYLPNTKIIFIISFATGPSPMLVVAARTGLGIDTANKKTNLA